MNLATFQNVCFRAYSALEVSRLWAISIDNDIGIDIDINVIVSFESALVALCTTSELPAGDPSCCIPNGNAAPIILLAYYYYLQSGLQSVLNTAARLIYRLPFHDNIIDVLSSVWQRIKWKVAVSSYEVMATCPCCWCARSASTSFYWQWPPCSANFQTFICQWQRLLSCCATYLEQSAWRPCRMSSFRRILKIFLYRPFLTTTFWVYFMYFLMLWHISVKIAFAI